MSLWLALLLGLVQGLTEFIPVSSSGHLVLLHDWFGINRSGLAFDVALHFGTLLALLLCFRHDLLKLARGVFRGGAERRLAIILAVATVPAVLTGLFLDSLARSGFRSPTLVALNLIIVAILMLAAEWYYARHQPKTKKVESTDLKQGAAIGLAQALALVPGTSRSGLTISTGLFAGLDRVAATRFSFLLGIPIMAGAIIKIFAFDGGASQISNQPAMFSVGIIAAFVSGLAAIAFMLRFLANHSLKIFAYYRIGIGLLVLLFSVSSM